MSGYLKGDVVKVRGVDSPCRIVGVYGTNRYHVRNQNGEGKTTHVRGDCILGLWGAFQHQDVYTDVKRLHVPDENGKVDMTAPYGQLTPEEVLQCIDSSVVLEKRIHGGWERVQKPLSLTTFQILNHVFRKYEPIKINDVRVEPPLNCTDKPYMGYTVSLHTRKVVMIRIADGQVGWACFDQAYDVLKAILTPLGIQPVDKESNLAELWCKG